MLRLRRVVNIRGRGVERRWEKEREQEKGAGGWGGGTFRRVKLLAGNRSRKG